jgi:hypothetical protein
VKFPGELQWIDCTSLRNKKEEVKERKDGRKGGTNGKKENKKVLIYLELLKF